MTRDTFLSWVNRYANAVRELSWAGGIQDGVEREKVTHELKRELATARKKLLSVWASVPPERPEIPNG